jgi:hypothetical protein
MTNHQAWMMEAGMKGLVIAFVVTAACNAAFASSPCAAAAAAPLGAHLSNVLVTPVAARRPPQRSYRAPSRKPHSSGYWDYGQRRRGVLY